MQEADRNEKRRFVGREFLLWLWFESEAFEATLSTRTQGTFGLWIEKHLVLSVGKEATRIKGTFPAGSREAKEALALGKLPEAAGLHLSWGDREVTFTLRAEKMALSGLVLPTVLGDEEEETPALVQPPPRRKKGKRSTVEVEQERVSDERHEAFYERMLLTREVEGLVETLYRDFLALRLGDTWPTVIEPALAAWIRGGKIDAERYRKARDAAVSSPKRAAPANRPKSKKR
ncbi:MAG TPA: hypothetical protein VH062_12045 [Polyangiaceae bacterium]|nr:hypothetical protein [Polyangiaceae bacterium]